MDTLSHREADLASQRLWSPNAPTAEEMAQQKHYANLGQLDMLATAYRKLFDEQGKAMVSLELYTRLNDCMALLANRIHTYLGD